MRLTIAALQQVLHCQHAQVRGPWFERRESASRHEQTASLVKHEQGWSLSGGGGNVAQSRQRRSRSVAGAWVAFQRRPSAFAMKSTTSLIPIARLRPDAAT